MMAAVMRKKEKLSEARALYEAGASYAGIAASLDMPAGSVRRWASDDRRAGRPWRHEAAERAGGVPKTGCQEESPHAQAALGCGTHQTERAGLPSATANPSQAVPQAESTAEDQQAQPVTCETETAAPDPPKDRAELCRRLENRLALLVVEAEKDLKDAKVEERFLKLCRVLESLRSDTADLDAQLEAMRRFADFCVRELTEEEMAPVRGPIRQFVDYLKEEHS
jgi:hypothetical protein